MFRPREPDGAGRLRPTLARVLLVSTSYMHVGLLFSR